MLCAAIFRKYVCKMYLDAKLFLIIPFCNKAVCSKLRETFCLCVARLLFCRLGDGLVQCTVATRLDDLHEARKRSPTEVRIRIKCIKSEEKGLFLDF